MLWPGGTRASSRWSKRCVEHGRTRSRCFRTRLSWQLVESWRALRRRCFDGRLLLGGGSRSIDGLPLLACRLLLCGYLHRWRKGRGVCHCEGLWAYRILAFCRHRGFVAVPGGWAACAAGGATNLFLVWGGGGLGPPAAFMSTLKGVGEGKQEGGRLIVRRRCTVCWCRAQLMSTRPVLLLCFPSSSPVVIMCLSLADGKCSTSRRSVRGGEAGGGAVWHLAAGGNAVVAFARIVWGGVWKWRVYESGRR